MSYEKTTWANGDVITATKLNKMEEGIAGMCPVVFIYFPDSSAGCQAVGLDFATALSMVQEGKPFLAFSVDYNSSSGWFSAGRSQTLGVYYEETYPDQIDLQITGGVGYTWTADGISYYD